MLRPVVSNEMLDLLIERLAGVLAQYGSDVIVQLGVLAMQCQDRDADGGENKTQLPHVLAQFETQWVVGGEVGWW